MAPSQAHSVGREAAPGGKPRSVSKVQTHPAENGKSRPPRARKELRIGFSTGTAATAAAQGALRELLGLPCADTVEVSLPGGGSLFIPLRSHGRSGSRGEAMVVKDAGDDPDATHGAEIGARVWLTDLGWRESIVVHGGEGVGRVTKPGLPLPVGGPAINPVPRRMLQQGLAAVWQEGGEDRPLQLCVEIFVPRGAEIARHTLNPRLGILDGISILGTTGLVKPFSHQAYRATIVSALKVARASGLRQVVLTTGGKSEAYLQALLPHLPDEAFVQMGDYVRFALKVAVELGFVHMTVGAFFGKAVKIAQGFDHTHASRGRANFKDLGLLIRDITGDLLLAAAAREANTAREVLEMLPGPSRQAVAAAVGRRMVAALREHAGPTPRIAALILDFDGFLLAREERFGGAS